MTIRSKIQAWSTWIIMMMQDLDHDDDIQTLTLPKESSVNAGYLLKNSATHTQFRQTQKHTVTQNTQSHKQTNKQTLQTQIQSEFLIDLTCIRSFVNLWSILFLANSPGRHKRSGYAALIDSFPSESLGSLKLNDAGFNSYCLVEELPGRNKQRAWQLFGILPTSQCVIDNGGRSVESLSFE